MEGKRVHIDGEETQYIIYEDSSLFNTSTGRWLKGTYHRNEYHSYQLFIKGKEKSYSSHVLVGQAFLPNPNGLPVIHHKDGDKHNNHVDNLEWVSLSENTQPQNIFNKPTPTTSEYLSQDLDLNVWSPIKQAPNYYINRLGVIVNSKTKLILKQSNRNGYSRLCIAGKQYSVHRLVYETFVGEIKGVIDHIDGNKQNNSLDNLRDISQSENMTNAQQKGHKGQKKVHQYTLDDVFVKEFSSLTNAAKAYGVTYAAIRSAALRNGTSCGYKWKIVD